MCGRFKEAGLLVLVDAMWGNGAGWFPRILAGGKTRVVEIHAERHPLFPEMSRPSPSRPTYRRRPGQSAGDRR
jgi:phosphomannomutase